MIAEVQYFWLNAVQSGPRRNRRGNGDFGVERLTKHTPRNKERFGNFPPNATVPRFGTFLPVTVNNARYVGQAALGLWWKSMGTKSSVGGSNLMQKPPEAAEIIVKVLREGPSPALTFDDLQERTGLAAVTIDATVRRLRKDKKVQTSEDGHGTVWVAVG